MTTGGCMCGAVKYAFEGQPVANALCHCTDCQKWSGGAFTANVVIPKSAFKVTQGEPAHIGITADSGKNNEHWFCSKCGSALWTEPEVMGDMMAIKSGGLDEKAAREGKMSVEYFNKSRLNYTTPIGGAEQKPAFADS